MSRKSPFQLPEDVLQHVMRQYLFYRYATNLLITCKESQAEVMLMYKKYVTAKATLIQSYWRRNMALVKRLNHTYMKAGEDGCVVSHFSHVASWCFEECIGDDYSMNRSAFTDLLNGYILIDDDDLEEEQYALDLMTPEQRAERENLKETLLPLWPENHHNVPPLRKYNILRNIPKWVFVEFYDYY